MFTFRKFLREAKGGKNLHLEHLEDAIVNDGSAGMKEALAFAESLLDMLSGNAKSSHGVTVKWDGAPAVFCGINPENGKFFVGTKSVFNVTPKINYTNADIDANHSGGLADKLKVALECLPKLGITDVLQGDMMYTKDDLKTETIDGESHVTFTPNTITYAVASSSKLAKQINASKMGIVFHTKYTGTEMASMKASFGVDASSLKQTRDVWFEDANLKDESGVATFTDRESTSVLSKITNAKRMADRATLSTIDAIVSDAEFSMLLKTYYNTLVRNGNIGTPSVIYAGFREYMEQRFDVAILKLKTERGKKAKEDQKKKMLSFIRSNSKSLIKVFAIQQAIRDIKLDLLRQVQKVKSIGTFIRTNNGFKVTAPEGYVAIDRISNTAYKLVDRMTFSRANFNAAKNWEKA